MNLKKKIAVAMSGGVDSAVAALLLKKEGFSVTGVNLNLWSCFKGGKAKTCCSPADRQDAAKVCEMLEIPFVSVDMRELFQERIIRNFVEEYSVGRTPNPCIHCNSLIKFDAMLDWVGRNLGSDTIATGHYARIERDENGFHLLRGDDKTKDQSYFLFSIPSERLPNIIFPLGNMTKSESRRIAIDAGLPVAEKTESQEVCFIPDNDTPSFIEDFYPDHAKPRGNFVDKDGKILGRHRGTHAYTIGQRRGLGVAMGDRRYVIEIRPEKNEIVLGDDDDLYIKSLTADNLNIFENPGDEFDAFVKIRYKTEPVSAHVKINAGIAHVEFNEPVRAVTPGQAAVFYKDDLVIGGGWIR